MVTNDTGQVALAYYQTIPHVVSANRHEYAFVVRANICLAWIDAADADTVLRITKNCCGNHNLPVYRYANESDVRRWTAGGGS